MSTDTGTIADTRFSFDLNWSEPRSATSMAADATRGRLVVKIGGVPVWGGLSGLDWTWIELLEHLARFWADIMIEEVGPLGLRCAPAELRSKARVRWENLPAEVQEAEEEQVYFYEEAHDLAAGLHGVFPAPLWLSREGEMMRVGCKDATSWISLSSAEQILEGVGDAIAARLRDVTDKRATVALEAWSKRRDVAPERAARLAAMCGEEATVVHQGTDFTTGFPLAPCALCALCASSVGTRVASVPPETIPTHDSEPPPPHAASCVCHACGGTAYGVTLASEEEP